MPRPGTPLDITLTVNGKVFAEGKVPLSAPLGFTANDCLDLGSDLGSPVSLDYYDAAPFPFNGTLGTTTIKYTKRFHCRRPPSPGGGRGLPWSAGFIPLQRTNENARSENSRCLSTPGGDSPPRSALAKQGAD